MSRFYLILLSIISIFFIQFCFYPVKDLLNIGYRYECNSSNIGVKIDNDVYKWDYISKFILPLETFILELDSRNGAENVRFRDFISDVKKIGANIFKIKAPKTPGLYIIEIYSRCLQKEMVLNLFVMIPFNELVDGKINSYYIGNYPEKRFKDLSQYDYPLGFIEVTEENQSTLISPHYRLGDFICKQEGEFPKYIALTERMIKKIEALTSKLKELGYVSNKLFVMSGYRTPYYNRSIGNVVYSRHIYGDAVDIFVDENPQDNIMDDVNKDGKIDTMDAQLLYNIADSLYENNDTEYIGGLAIYDGNHNHGPFLHVDIRGYEVRW